MDGYRSQFDHSNQVGCLIGNNVGLIQPNFPSIWFVYLAQLKSSIVLRLESKRVPHYPESYLNWSCPGSEISYSRLKKGSCALGCLSGAGQAAEADGGAPCMLGPHVRVFAALGYTASTLRPMRLQMIEKYAYLRDLPARTFKQVAS